jgi:FAD/FMN-containing dehydrogenase
VTRTGERVRKQSPSGRLAADYLFYPDAQARSLGDELRRTLSCPVHFEAQARALYAADASNYRQVPIGVVLPRTISDVVEAVEVCRRHDAPILARGGGTGISGQSSHAAVVFEQRMLG